MFSVAVGLTALAYGCQLFVPGDLPDFTCTGSDPSSCPAGTYCDVSLGRCIEGDGAAPITQEDATSSDSAMDGGAAQSSGDFDAAPFELGAPCRVNAECRTSLCGTSTILTTRIVQSTGPICTKVCCTSADCPTGFVCFGGGTGGTYCVPAERAGRALTRGFGLAPGQPCQAPEDCRSGSCAGGVCNDTCCSSSSCAAGTLCRIPSAPPLVWTCARAQPDASVDIGGQCVDQPWCKNNNCIGSIGPDRRCRPPCCSDKDCVNFSDAGAGRCIYNPSSSSDFFKYCEYASSAQRFASGHACTANYECQSDFCDPELKQCVDVCCTDTDCAAGMTCRPSAVGTPFLRCVR